MFRKAHVTGESSAIPGEETGEDQEGAILLVIQIYVTSSLIDVIRMRITFLRCKGKQ
jgi:hypothetical protein